jgi:hypothetical protein
MQISTLDISGITTSVRRHQALLRFARSLFVYNLVIFLWVVITKLSQMPSFEGLLQWLTGPTWKFAVLALGTVGASYLILAHRLWWAYAVIMVAQVGYFFFGGAHELAFIRMSVLSAIGVITLPPMRPLAPLAIVGTIMTIVFSYLIIVMCLYSTAWVGSGGRVPPGAYGRRLAPLEPLRPSRLLDFILPGHRSQNVTLWEAAIFSFSSLLFAAAAMTPFFGIRNVQNALITFSSQVQTCTGEGSEATIACWAQYFLWSQTAFDLAAPVVIAVICVVLANRIHSFGRQHFVNRLAELPIAPAGSTLFLRSFRDDQMRIRRASLNLFSFVVDFGRVPATLDELMLERLDGRGDLIAIGNPQDHKGAARQSPWGAQRLYVDDAHWQETVTMLSRDADRIVLCIDASDGVRWEIAHVLQSGHANKTLFFLHPSIDVLTRTRQLTEEFGASAADLASVDVDRILALHATSPEQLTLMLCNKPERDAYLVAARLAFEDQAGSRAMSANGMVRPCSCPASELSWQGAPKTRSAPCLRHPIPRSP